MKRWQALLVVVALGGVVLYSLRGAVAVEVMRFALPRMMTADPIGDLPDGLHLTLCGAGSPLPDPKRSGPCVGVVAGGDLFVVDAGSGAARNLNRLGLPVARVEAVFLTHFHSDHIDGLGELALQRWAAVADAKGPLPLFGPEGVESVAAGFNEAYSNDQRYRVAHHGATVMVPEAAGFVAKPFVTPEAGRPTVVWDRDGVKITSFRVDHAPIDPAVGYRFDYAGRSLVITGDTIQSPEIERISGGVDLLVHEALAPHLVALMVQAATDAQQTKRAKILNDVLDYHASPVDAAETAQAAGVGHLLFYHIVPPLILPGMDVAFLEGVDDAYSGDMTLGQDGTRVSLPAGSTAIELSGD
jgi:ribonuclease Z